MQDDNSPSKAVINSYKHPIFRDIAVFQLIIKHGVQIINKNQPRTGIFDILLDGTSFVSQIRMLSFSN